MTLKLYNTLTRKKETFKPIKKGSVGFYSCGLTVYNYAHIGNLRSYIFSDIVKRVLLYNKYKVKHVINITDVGHLTSDADTGEDKMLKGAKREGKTAWEIAKFYTEAFKKDLKQLNILSPNIWCKATDHIKEQLALIKRLEKKGFTYKADGNVIFDTSKLKDYGKLIGAKIKVSEKHSRVGVDKSKKSPTDFVLWFTKSKFADQEMKWDSEYGKGYPGWHVECSAMSMKYLGETFDIHSGGTDHIGTHHSNEIAQSEAATGKKFVNYWLHNAFLVLKGEKMAKSKENFLRLQLLIDKGYDPLDYRFFCLGAHYRSELTFTFEALDNAKNAFNMLKERIKELKKEKTTKGKNFVTKYKKEFLEAMNDDLNTPVALSVLWAVIKDKKLGSKEKLLLVADFDKVFGLDLDKLKEEKIPKVILDLAKKREAARKKKDWALSDKLRDEAKKKGYLIEDDPKGFKVKKL